MGMFLFDNPKNLQERQHNKKTRILAENVMLEQEKMMMAGAGEQSSMLRVSQLLSLFLESKKNPNTQMAFIDMHKKLQDCIKYDPVVMDFSVRECEDFLEYLYDRMSINAANTVYSRLNILLNYGVKKGLMATNPCPRVDKQRSTETAIEYLEREELKCLIEADCPWPDVKRIFLFTCFTGLRVSDLETLEWDDIRDDKIMKRQQKTKEVVVIPLSQKAKEYLGENPGYGKPFKITHRKNLNDKIKNWVVANGIQKNLSIHCGRHTFATLLMTQGVDIYTVKELLGHKNLSSTLKYAKVVNSKREEAIGRLDDL
ncbi:hypothetical protein GCM10023331_39850 [Algivirga pacifica]|uniref:Tyr recombinase domain-containing protein n=2 Tax=Algivirga pacifica TaxID=1162670 RepID=A0ABP9DLN0_9BACT